MPKKISEIAGNIQRESLLDDVMDEISSVWTLLGGCNNQPGPRPDYDGDDDPNNNGGNGGGGDGDDTPDQQPKPKRAQLI